MGSINWIITTSSCSADEHRQIHVGGRAEQLLVPTLPAIRRSNGTKQLSTGTGGHCQFLRDSYKINVCVYTMNSKY